jgi:hypothetical protein
VNSDEQSRATVDKRVAQYIQVRDKLKELDDAHDAAKKPLVELQNLLTGWMQKFMDDSKSESIKTAHGTCYASVRYTASLPDAEAFMKFVIENNKFEMLDRRANSTAVRAYVEETGGLPPGVNLSALRTIGVRRNTGT